MYNSVNGTTWKVNNFTYFLSWNVRAVCYSLLLLPVLNGILVHSRSFAVARPWLNSDLSLATLKTSDPPTDSAIRTTCSMHRCLFPVDFHATFSEFHEIKNVKPHFFVFLSCSMVSVLPSLLLLLFPFHVTSSESDNVNLFEVIEVILK